MKAAAFSILAVLSAPILPAVAQDAGAPALSEIIAGLEADGYGIEDVDVDRDAIEIEAVRSDQRRVELHLDPRTGEILRETSDD